MFDYGHFKFESKQELFDKAIRYWNPGQDQVLAEGRASISSSTGARATASTT